MAKKIIFWIGIAVTAVCLFFVFKGIKYGMLWQIIKHIKVWLLLLTVAIRIFYKVRKMALSVKTYKVLQRIYAFSLSCDRLHVQQRPAGARGGVYQGISHGQQA